MKNRNYILQNKEAIPVEDILEWAKWFETANRHVRQDTIGKVRISTVFLGLDHQWHPNERPLLFETMIFGGEHDEYQDRYTTWEEAERGHEEALNMVKNPAPTP
jgi:hypothetical protein